VFRDSKEVAIMSEKVVNTGLVNAEAVNDCGGRGKFIGTVDEAEILKDIMLAEGVNNTALARLLGVDRNAIWQRLNNQRRMSVAMFEEMLRVLGYRLVVEPVVKNVYGTNGEVVRTREKYEVRG
jgi:predicted DNA-binding protein (UPF0251 family)